MTPSISEIQSAIDRLKEYSSRKESSEFGSAIRTLVSLAKSYVEAEMPKKMTEPIDDEITDNTFETGYNQAIDDCHLAMMKVKQITYDKSALPFMCETFGISYNENIVGFCKDGVIVKKEYFSHQHGRVLSEDMKRIENIIWGSEFVKRVGGAGFVEVENLAKAICEAMRK